jgi:imidazolonepropionase-like amidohydrolase
VLRPGGIFLNADHVASKSESVQKAWEAHREEMRRQTADPAAEDWRQFWAAYSVALGVDRKQIVDELMANWEGVVEAGMPLTWHLDRLRASGFTAVDCFWRCDCDAIYGGFRS